MSQFKLGMGLGLGVGFLHNSGHVSKTECVYSKIQRVDLKTRSKEERQRDLRVTMEIITGVGPICQQNVSLQVTDDDDPLLLYSLLISEDDFKSVKSQQGLLVDFENFPGQFVRLLEHCKGNNDNQSPRFLLILEEDERDSRIDTVQAHLKIVETNNFKHLCHLDLRIGEGNDSDVKKLMALKIRQLKEAVSKNEKELTQLKTQLNDCLQRLDLKCCEIDELQKKWREEKNQLMKQHSIDLAREYDKLSSAQDNWQEQRERDKRESKIKHEHMISNLESQLTQLTSQNHVLFEKNCQAESANREKCSQLEALEKQLTNILREVGSLKKQNSKLDLDYHEKEKLVNNLRTKCAVIEQEVKDKSLLLSKQQELVQNANEQKALAEENLHKKECTLQRKNISLKNLSDELVKANEILTKLQIELVSIKGKLKMRTDIAVEQEQLLDSKHKAILDFETKVSHLEQKVKDLELSDGKLRDSLTEAESKIEEKDKQLRNSDNVIHWLNRQLTGAQSELHNSPLPGYSSTPVFQPFSSKRRSGLETLVTSRATPAIIAQSSMPSKIPSVDPRSTKRVTLAVNSKVTNVDKSKTLQEETSTPAPPTFLIQPSRKAMPSTISSAYFPKTTTSPTNLTGSLLGNT